MYEQERVLARLQQRVLRESNIIACFLSGSYGRRTGDAYSDLDVALVFAGEAAREAAYQQRREFVRSVVPYVPAKSFDADHIRPYFHIALYGNGTKVDYRYETQSELKPNPWDREIRILKDSDGWAERFQTAAPAAAPPQPILSGQALADLDDRFWVMFWDVFRQLQRGDMAKPFPIYLQLLHFTLPPLLSMLPLEHPAHQGLLAARWDGAAPTLAHMRRLLDSYAQARAAVVQRHNIAFVPDEVVERQIKGLVAKA